MHGYELRKRLNLMLGWGRVLSYGSLYPALKKMLRGRPHHRGRHHHDADQPRPADRLRGHRGRATSEFHRLMSEVGPTAWEDDNFDIRFAFFSSTDMEIRLRVLEGRRSRLQERLDARAAPSSSAPRPRSTATPRELQRHGVESVEREVRWLSDLIHAERGDARHHRTVATRPPAPPALPAAPARQND